jgi:hypothetical protein
VKIQNCPGVDGWPGPCSSCIDDDVLDVCSKCRARQAAQERVKRASLRHVGGNSQMGATHDRVEPPRSVYAMPARSFLGRGHEGA